jgi:ubiquinone/menaquinone biosynthesis C-methylase UbiE
LNFLNYIAKTQRINQHPLGEKGTKILLNLFPKKTIKILEIGCGTGHTAAIILNDAKLKYYGIDSSKWMIKSTKKRLKDLSIQNAVLNLCQNHKLDFESNYFDVVFCESVLAIQSLEEVDVLLSEIFRVLRKDGMFLANESIWKVDTKDTVITKINDLMLSKLNLIQSGPKNNKSNWESLLIKNKFNIEKFNLLSTYNEMQTFENNKNYIKSLKYTLQKKRLSLLNPVHIFQFLYVKTVEKRFKSLGNFIESFIIVCKKQ